MTLKLGPYVAEKIIGRGGMGTVYAAVDDTTHEKFAVKVLAAGFANDDHFRHRFEAEIEALIKLKHPNIVEIKAYGEQGGHLYYAMELVEGSSLFDELKSGRRFNWREVCGIGTDICHALRHAHDRGVIHRDLKPGNLLLKDNGHCKLTDFGIAKLFGGRELTAAGSVIGTLDYMAPEQVRGEPVTTRSDLYSLGSVLFALLARRPPFASRSHADLIKCIESESPPAVSHFAHEVPDELEAIVDKLLAKDPEQRIGTAMGVANRLTAVLRDGHVASDDENPTDDEFDVSGDPLRTIARSHQSAADRTVRVSPSGIGSAAKKAEMPATVVQTEAKSDQPAAEQAAEKSPPEGRFTTVDEQRRRQAQGSFYPQAAEPSIWRRIMLPGTLLLVIVALAVLGILYAPPLSLQSTEDETASGDKVAEDDLPGSRQFPRPAEDIREIAALYDEGHSDQADKQVDEFLKTHPNDPAVIVVGLLKESRSVVELLPLVTEHADANPELAQQCFESYIAVHQVLSNSSVEARVCLRAAQAKLARIQRVTAAKRERLSQEIDRLFLDWPQAGPGVRQRCQELLEQYQAEPWAADLLAPVQDLLQLVSPPAEAGPPAEANRRRQLCLGPIPKPEGDLRSGVVARSGDRPQRVGGHSAVAATARWRQGTEYPR